MWVVSELLTENRWPHCSQTNSLLCFSCLCSANSSSVAKAILQVLHLITSSCTKECFFSLLLLLNCLAHTSQMQLFLMVSGSVTLSPSRLDPSRAGTSSEACISSSLHNNSSLCSVFLFSETIQLVTKLQYPINHIHNTITIWSKPLSNLMSWAFFSYNTLLVLCTE